MSSQSSQGLLEQQIDKGNDMDSQPNTSSQSNTSVCTYPGCVKTFRDDKALKKHLLTHGPKQYECSECGKCFTEKSKLKRHFLTHTGEKSFRCTFEDCNKSFALNSNLIVHMRSHIDQRPFVCHVDCCNKSFKRSTHLSKHAKIH